MKLFSYVIRYDTGFAPNPYGRYCTLATCKPQIRRHARPGDWVLGVGSKNNVGNGKLVYAMQVSEVLPIEQYNADPRFQYKTPAPEGKPIQRYGDNIYYKDKSGKWRQRFSRHTLEDMEHDLGGVNVLVARRFFYFGDNAVSIPARYGALVCRGRGHRCNFPEEVVEHFVAWLSEKFPPGRHGEPSNGLLSPSEVAPRKERPCGSKRSPRHRCH
jgi:hypothetical protein